MDIEDPAPRCTGMCREGGGHILTRGRIAGNRLAIPEGHRDLVATAGNGLNPEIYGRFVSGL